MSDDQKEPETESSSSLELTVKHFGDTRVAPAHGIAAIALDLAMKFHDINTVQDGVLYQQYKMEGKNMHSLHLDHVFETAKKIELWLLASSERIAKVIIDAIEVKVEDDVPLTSDPSAPIEP